MPFVSGQSTANAIRPKFSRPTVEKSYFKTPFHASKTSAFLKQY
jgi:hypothetical protein